MRRTGIAPRCGSLVSSSAARAGLVALRQPFVRRCHGGWLRRLPEQGPRHSPGPQICPLARFPRRRVSYGLPNRLPHRIPQPGYRAANPAITGVPAPSDVPNTRRMPLMRRLTRAPCSWHARLLHLAPIHKQWPIEVRNLQPRTRSATPAATQPIRAPGVQPAFRRERRRRYRSIRSLHGTGTPEDRADRRTRSRSVLNGWRRNRPSSLSRKCSTRPSPGTWPPSE